MCLQARLWRLRRVLTLCETGESHRNATSISTLPDNVLLEIFDVYRKIQGPSLPPDVWKWHLLVHVCRRWRQIAFSSPRHLDLRIFCTEGIPVRKDLGIWPALPIVVQYGFFRRGIAPDEEDNAKAALEHPDRVSRVELRVTGSQLGNMATILQEPFPVLTHLLIFTKGSTVPVIPSGFLGGSAPCLQEIRLYGVPFPTLPTLLLSASDLVVLSLDHIPLTGYISPGEMVASLAELPRLIDLQIEFRRATVRPHRMYSPPATRAVFPALTHFTFSGLCEYLEDFVARVDAPRLDQLDISYLIQVADFEVPQLSEFINRSEYLKRTLSRRCVFVLDHGTAEFRIAGSTSCNPVGIFCEDRNWQISQITHVISWIPTTLSNIVHFSLYSPSVPFNYRARVMEEIEWLQLLRLFSSVQTMFVSTNLAGDISRVLEDIAGVMVTEVLPALDLLCLQDQPASSVDKFIALRRDSGHPVTIINARREFDDRLEAYS